MNKYQEAGFGIGEGMRMGRYHTSEGNGRMLLRFPATAFDEYVPNPNTEYPAGYVLKMSDDPVSKYMFTRDGKLDVSPSQSNMCKLFRNGNRYPYVEEEFLESGFERYWENPNRPEEDGWYRVKLRNDGEVMIVSDKTSPPNAPDRWEKLAE